MNNKLDFKVKSGVFTRVFSILFFVLQVQFLHAQEQPGVKTEKQPASLVITGGGEIFSADDDFNNQILENKIHINDAAVSSVIVRNQGNEIVLKSKKPSKSEDFASQLKKAKKKAEEESLRSIKKKLAEFESQKEHFQADKIADHTSESHFTNIQRNNKDYVTSSSHQGSGKFIKQNDNSIVQRALDFLHTERYHYYNNKSISHCYARVFSVRPPPVLV